MDIPVFKVGKEKKNTRDKNLLCPKLDPPLRCLVVAEAGSGKTNLIIQLLRLYLDFDTLCYYSTSLDVEKVKKFREEIEDLEMKRGGVYSDWGDSLEEAITIKRLLELKEGPWKDLNRNLYVFDDLMMEKDLSLVERLYSHGRPHGISCIFIAQDYSLIPAVVRRNTNFIILFKGLSGRQLREIWQQYAKKIKLETFEKVYHAATEKQYSFFVIDLQSEDTRLKYRMKFDNILDPEWLEKEENNFNNKTKTLS
jgi:hypothetical protein